MDETTKIKGAEFLVNLADDAGELTVRLTQSGGMRLMYDEHRAYVGDDEPERCDVYLSKEATAALISWLAKNTTALTNS